MAKKSRHSLDGDIKIVRRGLAIYKVNASPYYRARIWSPADRRYIVKSTKETSRTAAMESAEEIVADLRQRKFLDGVPKNRTFEFFAENLTAKQRKMVDAQQRHRNHAINDLYLLNKKNDGINAYFGRRDVTTIKTSDIDAYIDWVAERRGERLTPSSLNKRIIIIRKVLKLARDAELIDAVPDTPLVPRFDNPRPFFKFEPIVSRERDQYQLLLRTAKEMAKEHIDVRWVPITDEIYDFILFMTHSFLRPTESEVFALTHDHVTVADDPKRLILTVAKGKTGHRVINTLGACVSVYERILKRNPKHKPSDYLFFSTYKNRATAKRIVQRQFNAILDKSGLKHDPASKTDHTVYSLRHTAICMRIIKSEGRVNIFNLAKTAGTSVEQIERFYARHLPLTREMARNLQTFGAERE